MVIDARNKLKPEDITHFLENVTSTIILVIEYSDKMKMPKGDETSSKEFVSKLLSIDCDDLTCITCSNEETKLLITGMDINWWKANARRYNKLYKAAEEVFNAVPPQTYRLGVATLIEGQLSQIKTIEGTKDVVLRLLNEDIKKRYLDSFLKAQLVINLAYEDGDEHYLEEWLTLDELKEIGAIKF